jgi:hypothetical protein
MDIHNIFYMDMMDEFLCMYKMVRRVCTYKLDIFWTSKVDINGHIRIH